MSQMWAREGGREAAVATGAKEVLKAGDLTDDRGAFLGVTKMGQPPTRAAIPNPTQASRLSQRMPWIRGTWVGLKRVLFLPLKKEEGKQLNRERKISLLFQSLLFL